MTAKAGACKPEAEFPLFGACASSEPPFGALTSFRQIAFRQIGASNHAAEARGLYDYYATEPNAIDELLGKEAFNHSVWEPACGQCHLVKRLEEFGHDVRASDLVVRPCDHAIITGISRNTAKTTSRLTLGSFGKRNTWDAFHRMDKHRGRPVGRGTGPVLAPACGDRGRRSDNA